MACFSPLFAYQDLMTKEIYFAERGTEGKSNNVKARDTRPLTLPCGQCVGCRLERSRQWAVRCMHESQMHERNSFVTLTYNDNSIPYDFSLNYRHFQLFMKRVRARYRARVRFYMCGEYGEENARPHYHACLFGLGFDDRYYWRKSESGFPVFRSPELESLWSFGHCEVGDVTFESAAYVARYIMKKVTGASADEHYKCVDGSTGEVFQRVPEFTRMSLKPGIGSTWFDKYRAEVFPLDRVVVRGVECKPPRYYKYLLDSANDDISDVVEFARAVKARKRLADNTDERLKVREVVLRARIKSLKRSV